MSIWLQILLGLSVAGVAAFLIPFLLQLRRTAAAVERLADSAAKDLRQISEDIHQTREQVDAVALLVRQNLERPSVLTKVVAGLLGGLSLLRGGGEGGMNFLKTLLTGLRTALHLFHRSRNEPEEGHHE